MGGTAGSDGTGSLGLGAGIPQSFSHKLAGLLASSLAASPFGS